MSGHPINPTKRNFFIFFIFDLVVFGLHGMTGTPKKLKGLAMEVAPKKWQKIE